MTRKITSIWKIGLYKSPKGDGIMEKRKYSVTPQDRMNYVLGLYSADQQINAVLYFPVGISKEILEESVRITLQLQPVLNNRFVENDIPYWEEHSSDTNSSICFLQKEIIKNLK